MREILFRGKRKDNGEWVYGDLIHRKIWKSKFEVIRVADSGFDSYTEYEIATDTIGQFTGLTDKNGTKIFEGDIHEHIVGGKSYLFVVKHGKYYDFEAADKRYGWHFQNTKTNDCNSFYGDEEDYANIIGNIHDNPELLKGGAE